MDQNRRLNRTFLLIFALMGCFFAANQNLVGSVARALHMDQTQMGGLISALYCGCVTAVLFFGEFAQHMGKRLAAAVL